MTYDKLDSSPRLGNMQCPTDRGVAYGYLVADQPDDALSQTREHLEIGIAESGPNTRAVG